MSSRFSIEHSPFLTRICFPECVLRTCLIAIPAVDAFPPPGALTRCSVKSTDADLAAAPGDFRVGDFGEDDKTSTLGGANFSISLCPSVKNPSFDAIPQNLHISKQSVTTRNGCQKKKIHKINQAVITSPHRVATVKREIAVRNA